MTPTITAVVVSYGDPAATVRAIGSLVEQSVAPIEVLVVDNDVAEPDAGPSAIETTSPSVQVVHSGTNLGYTRGANLAAGQAQGDWLFFLNPDAVAARDCLERLLAAVDGVDVAIVGAQVLLPDGRINAGDNPINIAGISWSGGYGAPREHGPARDTAAVSGAALLVRRDVFLEVGGLCPYFFLYVDDTDLAWRIRLSGRRVRYCPEATVVHHYEFDKGAHKWFYLERNRWWALLSNLGAPSLLLLFPLLAVTEAAIVIRAISEGWFREKACAWVSLLKQMPRLIRWRRAVQTWRDVSDYRVLCRFSAGVETSLIDTGLPAWTRPCLDLYRNVLLCLLRPSRKTARRRAVG